MNRWRGAAMAAGSAALAGLPAGVASAATTPTQSDGPSAGSHCAVWAPTRTEACFATFAESLRWVGFAGVADDVTLESFFATSAAAAPTTRGQLSGERRTLDTPPGYAYGALLAPGASRVYWGPSSSCPSTWDSLVFDSTWNNRANAVMNGVCGSVKVFDAWSSSDAFSCDTSTWMATQTGAWGTTATLPGNAVGRTSCVGYSA